MENYSAKMNGSKDKLHEVAWKQAIVFCQHIKEEYSIL